ncbi:MAG: tRNA lysidine(34) synthetase TilS [Rhodocyclaceae bacterium]|nr:tRNA lysidine(34) synthetase TilS [Rhodocyclaceae bacterium]
MANSRKSLVTETSAARLADRVADCLDRHVRPQERLVLGLSGGVDSVCLLHALSQCRAGRDFHLTAVHVHHGLSPNADRWAAFCEALCLRYDVPFNCVRVEVERGTGEGLEAAARRARHAALARSGADWILLAHHRDDQAETLLFNLLRGAGLAGAAAMRMHRGRLLRPWLAVGRSEILEYAQEHGLEWIEDESNADVRHTRNFLRHEVIPRLARRFPAAVKNLAAAAGRFAEAQELLDELARLDLGQHCDFPVSVARLAALSEARARNALRFLLARQAVMVPSDARLHEAVRQLLTAAPDRHPSIPLGRHRLIRRRGMIYLESLEP